MKDNIFYILIQTLDNFTLFFITDYVNIVHTEQ